MDPILALDLGDTCGWAVLAPAGPLGTGLVMTSGVFDFGIRLEEHPGARWTRVRSVIREKAKFYAVRWIAWELIINAMGGFSKSTLYGQECQVVELCNELEVEGLAVAPNTLKKFATCTLPRGTCLHESGPKSLCTGRGNATKEELRAVGRKRWPKTTFATHDEIDARWIGEWAWPEVERRLAAPKGFAVRRKKA